MCPSTFLLVTVECNSKHHAALAMYAGSRTHRSERPMATESSRKGLDLKRFTSSI